MGKDGKPITNYFDWAMFKFAKCQLDGYLNCLFFVIDGNVYPHFSHHLLKKITCFCRVSKISDEVDTA